MSAGFSALGGMTKEQVARAMGDSLSRWIHSQKIVFAFHNDQSVKERYIARVKAHAYAGKIDYETELGIPCHIASLQDCIFQNIPLGERGTFPLAFLEAIPVGADLSLVIPRFLVWLLSDPDGAKYLYDERGKQAIETVVALYQRLIDGSTVSKEEWLTAYRAACGGDAEVAVHAAAGCGGSVDVAGAVTAEVARAEAEAARADAATQAAHFDAQAAAHGIPSTYSGSTFSLIAADDARAYGAARAEAIRATGEARARTAAETYAALAARAAADAVHAEVSAQARAEFAPHTGPENDDDYYTYYRDYDASHPGPYNPYPRLDANVMRTRYCQRMRDKLLELLRTAPVPRAN